MKFSSKITKWIILSITIMINIFFFQQTTYSSQKDISTLLKLAHIQDNSDKANTLTQQSTALDLNGEWLAYGYCCGTGTEVERIAIRHTDNYIVATKITGDEHVPAGNTTWEGNFTGTTSKIKFRGANKGFTNPKWIEATIQIISSNEILLSGSGVKITFKKTTNTPANFDLNGLWAAYGYCCGSGTEEERIVIRHLDNKVIATKITGDDYVPGGNITWEGNFDSNPFTAKFRGAEKGFKNPTWSDSTINVISNDEIILTPLKYSKITFKRIKEVEVKEDAGKLQISLGDAILFDLNSDNLKPKAKTILAEIKTSIIDKRTASTVIIEGYTDDIGSESYNLDLSIKRAQSVVNWMKSNGIKTTQIETKGYGENSPKYPNNNEENRAKNRRVEILIIQNEKF